MPLKNNLVFLLFAFHYIVLCLLPCAGNALNYPVLLFCTTDFATGFLSRNDLMGPSIFLPAILSTEHSD